MINSILAATLQTKLIDSIEVLKSNTHAPSDERDETEVCMSLSIAQRETFVLQEIVEHEAVSTVLKRLLKKLGHVEYRDDMSELEIEELLIELYRKKEDESRLTEERRRVSVF